MANVVDFNNLVSLSTSCSTGYLKIDITHEYVAQLAGL